MELAPTPPPAPSAASRAADDWSTVFAEHVRAHRFIAAGLAAGLIGLVLLLGQSLALLLAGTPPEGVRYALLGGAAGFATTALGALPALVLRSLPQRLEDSLLGLAAGMMLAASAFSLLLPASRPGRTVRQGPGRRAGRRRHGPRRTAHARS